MPDENTAACKIPPRWFRKNETVMGIIGNTHGVNKETSPAPMAARRCRAPSPRASTTAAMMTIDASDSAISNRRAVLYGGADYIAKANETVLAIVQVESALGLKNVGEIASVKGLDMIYIGPTDLALSLGRDIRAGLADSVLMTALDEILAATRKAGIRSGIYCRNADDAKAMFAKGFDLATVTSDDALLAAGAAVAAKFR
jgi:4-hydroxy-2-oxoheptanedioate aldolase